MNCFWARKITSNTYIFRRLVLNIWIFRKEKSMINFVTNLNCRSFSCAPRHSVRPEAIKIVDESVWKIAVKHRTTIYQTQLLFQRDFPIEKEDQQSHVTIQSHDLPGFWPLWFFALFLEKKRSNGNNWVGERLIWKLEEAFFLIDGLVCWCQVVFRNQSFVKKSVHMMAYFFWLKRFLLRLETHSRVFPPLTMTNWASICGLRCNQKENRNTHRAQF